MKYKSISVISVVILLLSVFTGLLNFESETLGEVPLGSRGAKTLYVGGTGAGNYTKIQDAIDNASAGDTIRVFNGVYNENIFINCRKIVILFKIHSKILEYEKYNFDLFAFNLLNCLFPVWQF